MSKTTYIFLIFNCNYSFLISTYVTSCISLELIQTYLAQSLLEISNCRKRMFSHITTLITRCISKQRVKIYGISGTLLSLKCQNKVGIYHFYCLWIFLMRYFIGSLQLITHKLKSECAFLKYVISVKDTTIWHDAIH